MGRRASRGARGGRAGSRPSACTTPSGGRSASRPGPAWQRAWRRCAAAVPSARCWARLATAAAIDDMPPSGGGACAGCSRKREARTSWPRLGPADAERTVVVVAHHDAPQSGTRLSARRSRSLFERIRPRALIEHAQHQPAADVADHRRPGRRRAGSVLGSRPLDQAGTVLSAGFAAAMADIGRARVVPGANDNATGVAALVALARALAARPTERTRVLLVSTSEEGLARAWRRSAGATSGAPARLDLLPLLDTVGSPHLCVLRGEGMRGMREYPALAGPARRAWPRSWDRPVSGPARFATPPTGRSPLAGGYECASLASCTHLKQPANYHWPTDMPENVDYGTVAEAVRLTEAVVRRLDERWIA